MRNPLAPLICGLAVTGLALSAQAGEGIDIETRWKGKPKTVEGELYLPEGKSGPFPAVVMIHGSAGPDGRYDFHRPALLKAGIAVLEVDFKSGIFSGPSDRPPVSNFLPFVFSTLDTIRKQATIDPKRVGLMGFSFGGYLSLQAAWKDVQEMEMDADTGYAAHVAYYPNCHISGQKWFGAFDKTITAPLYIFAGEKDSYGDGEKCAPFVEELKKTNPPESISLKIYPDTHHGFDGDNSWSGSDRAAIHNNGTAVLEPNPDAAKDAQALTIAFFKKAFGL